MYVYVYIYVYIYSRKVLKFIFTCLRRYNFLAEAILWYYFVDKEVVPPFPSRSLPPPHPHPAPQLNQVPCNSDATPDPLRNGSFELNQDSYRIKSVKLKLYVHEGNKFKRNCCATLFNKRFISESSTVKSLKNKTNLTLMERS